MNKVEPNKIMNLFNELIVSKQYFFPVIGKVNISDKHGVYIIYSPKDEVLHVGVTKTAKGGLNQRLLNHIRNQSTFSKGYMQKKTINLRNGYKFRFIEIDDLITRCLLEALTIGLLCPAHLGTGVPHK
jgi:hypothetical protein